MNFKPILIVLIGLNIPVLLFAQTVEDKIVESMIESMSEETPEDFDFEELSERLIKYRKSPINLNKATREKIKELPFLSPLQISNLLNHIQANGKLLEIYELQSIDAFDLETIRLLLNFATIDPPDGFENFSLKHLSSGTHDFLIRYARILKQQKGFTIPKDSNKSRYLGSPDRLFYRYRFNYKQNIQFSLNMEKDAGEHIWEKKYGPDFLSASLFLKDLKPFSKIVIGDYSLQFGQGLSLWSGLSFGKGSDISSIAKQDLGLKPYTSANEYSFFRGLATTINFGKMHFTPFVSFRKLDSSMDTDLNGNPTINSLLQSGLHRTPNELANRQNLEQLVYGANIEFENRNFSIGINAYKTQFNIPFQSQSPLYKQFDFTGNELTNIGLHYTKSFRNIYFFGEAARSMNSGFAFLNGALASLSNSLSVSVFQRNYQKNYHSFFNQAISENTTAYNERGLYYGINYKHGKKYDFLFYTDFFTFPWLKYRVDAPSSGHEIFGQLNYMPSKILQVVMRYKLKEKEQNSSANGIETYRRQTYRFELQYQLNKSFSLKNRAEISQYKTLSSPNQYGFLVFQDIKYSPSRSKISGNLRYAIFDTEGFDTRIYTYENDVLYSYSNPGFQNKGIRFYLNGRYRIKKGLDFWLKYSISKYDEVTSIGSGLDEIIGNSKPEIKLQLRYQL
ncbi:hypothetical protein Pedsa_1320 [Pseudopedobacter saltans DSM 12145]|uniref:Helix-hairpin-helix motif protein n=1 Tax=Pseudopedobacter saltans (strain ATCC 51119 / DSM 12145 / JCM 21818 / CCUG 39354 / LMG 10337 / NBRC 100064 / NCIMB 13643) TaxID=762903 RepID=F0SEJ7_PSESL|nr:hypothetical protein [Pseudopedobacter saltans]ADY51887.1 hypothetical protein Pedsa_1320 [Pseudopedobacter saltans DSM 12145]